jgi:hypothetical protein
LGTECRLPGGILKTLMTPSGGLCHPTVPDWIPLILRLLILEVWIWILEVWMSGCWQDWNGLEEVTEVTAFWREGIGKFSHARASGARRILQALITPLHPIRMSFFVCQHVANTLAWQAYSMNSRSQHVATSYASTC